MLTFAPLQNKYTKCYFAITSYRKETPAIGYTENHHIHPECLGGNNKKENMVRLTAREHYVCHLLLTKMLVGEPKKRMCYAFRSMHRKKAGMDRYMPGSHIYKITREAMDFTASEESRNKMRESAKRRPPISEETASRLSKSILASYTPELRAVRTEQFKNQIFTETHRENLSKSHTGLVRSEESKQKQGETLRGGNHHKCKTWTLQSPAGEVFTTRDMTTFCTEHNLNYSSLRNRARDQSREPLGKGSSKGWAVMSCT